MNPLIMQQLAADHINEMIAKADDRRQARQARPARAWQCRGSRPDQRLLTLAEQGTRGRVWSRWTSRGWCA